MTSLSNSVRRVRYSIMDQPLLNTLHSHLIAYPTPSNLNASWNWGSLAGICLVLQIVTGVCLAMHYTAHVDLAFASVQHIMRDVPSGWLLRYFHANGASFFFIVVYIHVFRGLYYNSYAQPRELVWLFGVIIRLMMIRTAFIGYVLPWGQMSLWGVQSPQIDVFSLFAICVDKPRLKSTQRIGPHHIDVLSVLFGSLLGDAYAEKRANATRICFQQENNNVEYLRGLHSFFAERFYTNSQIPTLQKRIGLKNTVRFVCRFKTWSFQSFNWLHDIFYKEQDGKWIKVVPESHYLQTYLTPLALAIWIMDDGGKSGSGLTLSTHSFTAEDIVRLSTFLTNFYGLKNSINSAGVENQYVIYIWKESMPKLVLLVYPYMVPGMIYKLGKYGEQRL